MTSYGTVTFMVLLAGELMSSSIDANLHSDVAADEFNSCRAATKSQRYLDSLYRCHPGDFSALTACEGQRIELRCPRAQFIAIRSAVFGWSNTFHMHSECARRRPPSAADHGCRLSCVLHTVADECDGRRRCSVDASTAMFGNRCLPGATKFLGILHTCVPKAVQRALGSDDDLDTLADPCGNSEFRDEITSRFLPPIITTSTPATTTTTAATTTTEFLYYWRNRNNGQDDHIMYPWGAVTTRVDSAWPPQLPTTSIPRHTRPGNTHNRKRPQHDEVHVGNSKKRHKWQLFSLADWIWTWQFANDNKEKFVLYMVIGLCFGTIMILVAVLFQFAMRQQTGASSPSGTARRSKSGRGGVGSSRGSPTWRDGAGHGMPESESSTGDDRTLHDVEDVELTAFSHHVDSLPRRAAPTPTVSGGGTATRCLHQPSAYGGVARPGSSMAAPATTANINRSYATISAGRCHTPGLAHYHHPTQPALVNGGMTLGHVPNGYGGTGVRYSALPSSSGAGGMGTATTGSGGGGGVMVNRGPMIGSLNRSFAGNQYGPLHDFSYPTTGYDSSTAGGGSSGIGGGGGRISDTSTPVAKSLHQPLPQPHFYD